MTVHRLLQAVVRDDLDEQLRRDCAETAVTLLCDGLDGRGNWLLVFDNAPNAAALKDVLPQSQTGHVLITSRNPDWKRVAQALQVNVWPLDEADKSRRQPAACTHLH